LSDPTSYAKEIAESLRSRHHAEKPHISVVSPSRDFFQSVLEKLMCHKTLIEEEEEDEDVEDLEISLTSIPPPWAFGTSIEAECTQGGQLHAEFSFVIRRGLGQQNNADKKSEGGDPNSYSEMKLLADVSVGTQLGASATLRADGRDVCSCNASAPSGPLWLLFMPKRLYNKLQQDMQQDKGLFEALHRALRWTAIRLDPAVDIGEGIPFQFCVCDDAPFVASVHEKDGENLVETAKYYHAVGLYLSHLRGRVSTYLVNLSGYIEPTQNPPKAGKERRSKSVEALKKACEGSPVYTWSSAQERWALGYLMEVSGVLEFKNGCAHKAEWTEHGIVGAYPLNAVLRIHSNQKIEMIDYVIEEEVVKKPEKDSNTIEEVLTSELPSILDTEGCENAKEILQVLAKAISSHIKSRYLYKFQREALMEVAKSLGSGEKNAVIIMAPTAAGKTLAFLLPIIVNYAVSVCKRGGQAPRGVLYYLLYPTKALANDQLDEVANILYSIWKHLPEEHKNLVPTFGLLHGDIKDEDYETPISFQLPNGSHTYVTVRCQPNDYGLPECYTNCDGCPDDFITFLERFFRPNRFKIYSDPPAILITDEDMLNRILSLRPNSYPGGKKGEYVAIYELHLFGGPYKRCPKCGFTYPPGYRGYRGRGLCRVCREGGLELRRAEPPRIVVIDEAHQLHGSFGSQSRYLFATMESHIERERRGITYIVSSATIANPEEFVSRLLNVKNITKVEAKLSGQEAERVNRAHLILMPRAYTRDNTLASALYALYERVPQIKGIVFVNSISENNDVTNALRGRLSSLNVEVKSHSTDYNRYDREDDEDRVAIERWFKQARERAVLVATPTMELGVDIGDVNFAALYGLPESLSSFIQRIGRAGRKQNALIITVANPFNNYDYFYYENYKLLTDPDLRSKAQGREVIPLSITNEEAWIRGVLRYILYLFKFHCANDGDCGYDYVSGEYRSEVVQRIIVEKVVPSLQAGIPDVFKVGSHEQKLKTISDKLSKISVTRTHTFDGVINQVAAPFRREEVIAQLRNLRGFDVQVVLSFPTGEKRTRDAYVFVRRGAPGQIISFRGRYYATTTYDGEYVSRLKDFLEGGKP
jgi:DEAD/DEAH box helicase domain-containing protein